MFEKMCNENENVLNIRMECMGCWKIKSCVEYRFLDFFLVLMLKRGLEVWFFRLELNLEWEVVGIVRFW